ncbi:hypothetical protein BDZ91DRAFT_386659 [Kalaharituber pfeilii]|nr:hypothetical protein BDZ91DRAFT_386659 [Kalaharituber pfeilii]
MAVQGFICLSGLFSVILYSIFADFAYSSFIDGGEGAHHRVTIVELFLWFQSSFQIHYVFLVNIQHGRSISQFSGFSIEIFILFVSVASWFVNIHSTL